MATSSFLERIALPPRDAEPPYKSLARSIRELIESGQLSPGDLLPSKRKVAIALHLSVATVGRAYELLARDRLIEGGRRRRVAGADAEQSADGVTRAASRRHELRGRVRRIEATSAGVQVVLDLIEHQELSVDTSWTAVEWLGLAPGRLAALSIDGSAIGLTQLVDDPPSN